MDKIHDNFHNDNWKQKLQSTIKGQQKASLKQLKREEEEEEKTTCNCKQQTSGQ